MTARYRLIILDHATLRETSLSRTVLWGCVLMVPLGSIAIAGAAFALGRQHQSKSAIVVTERAAFVRPSSASDEVASATSPTESSAICSSGMILIEGSYCPALQLACRTQMDPVGSALHGHRCAEYKQTARCLSPQKKLLRYCIDRDEHVASEHGLPQNRVTFEEARQICQAAGKRLCSDAEWTFACEGESGHPYPYGWTRDSRACNADRESLVDSRGELTDQRAVAGAHPGCSSPFGVRDLTGNVEEYAMDTDAGQPVRKGGYWQPGPNHCRHKLSHQELGYRGVEVGFRCCSDAVQSSQ